MKKIMLVLSHVLTALLACILTLSAVFFLLPTDRYSKLNQLSDLIEERFVGEKDRTAIEDAAAHAMIGALKDRWSYYIPASEYASFVEDKRNEYVGIGVTVQASQDGSGLLVVSVTAGGPAHEIGIAAGDVIVEAAGVSLAGKTVNEAGELIKGPANSAVELKLMRDGQPISVTVTRRAIKVPVAEGKLLEGGIGLVTIKNFNTNCFAESKQAIDSLLAQGATKLIFDVRNNGGGYADEMVKLLDYLLPEGQVFKTVDYKGNETVYTSDADYLDVPMMVLVNGNSYSAAECFAATLWEYGFAKTVGEKTSGKGYYQLVYELSDGSAVGLSVGKYFTHNNVNLEGVGLTPDALIEVDQETAAAIYAGTLDPMSDPQVLAAIRLLQENESNYTEKAPNTP